MRLGVILLIFILSFRPLIPLLDYGVNYDYISTVLCINKDKPQMHCNGKCHLAKEIAKKSAEDTQENNTGTLKFIDVFIVQEKITLPEKNSVLLHTTNNHFYKNLYSYISCKSILKPPVV